MKKKAILIGVIFVLLIAFVALFFVPASHVRVGYGESPEKVKISSMHHLEQGPFTVYFHKEHSNLAKELLMVLERTWQILGQHINLSLGSLRVAIIAPKGDTPNWGGAVIEVSLWETIQMLLGWQALLFPVWLPYKIESLEELGSSELFLIYWALPHEAVENVMVKKIYHDRANRWIGDGLAEYGAYIVTSELSLKARSSALKSRKLEVQNLLESRGNHNSYNLVQEFLYKQEESKVEVAGYGVSLAFWLQIAQKHGEGVIKTFWERISQRGFPNAREAARILSELTDEDIWTKLQTMDLHEVLRTLEAAAGGP